MNVTIDDEETDKQATSLLCTVIPYPLMYDM